MRFHENFQFFFIFLEMFLDVLFVRLHLHAGKKSGAITGLNVFIFSSRKVSLCGLNFGKLVKKFKQKCFCYFQIERLGFKMFSREKVKMFRLLEAQMHFYYSGIVKAGLSHVKKKKKLRCDLKKNSRQEETENLAVSVGENVTDSNQCLSLKK